MSTEGSVCGTGGWTGPVPGDPDDIILLQATPAYGGVNLNWSYPTTRPFAIAHLLIYRGTTNQVQNAQQIAVVGGNFYFDETPEDVAITYFYWIQVVSVNGTYGRLNGPASAMPLSAIGKIIEQLTNQIDQGFLATSLRADIEKIALIQSNLTQEINFRQLDDASLADAISGLQTVVDESSALVLNEITARTTGDSSLASQIITVQAMVDDAAALVYQESTARATADEAFAIEVNGVKTSVNNAVALVQQESTARSTADAAFANDITAVISTVANAQALIQQESTSRATADTALATQVNTVQTNINSVSALVNVESQARVNADAVIAGQVTSLQTATAGNLAAVQVNLQTNINTTNGKVNAIGALYTAKVSVNGLVGGFGIYNDGSQVEAGFDVDTFWIGRTAANKRKPFIINGGVVYIDTALIEDATITTAKIANTIQSTNYSATAGWQINKSGTMILNQANVRGQINVGNFVGYDWPASGGGVHLSQNGILAGNSRNGGKYFQIYTDTSSNNASIFTNIPAYIEDAQITTAKIGSAQIDTLRIAGNAVTVMGGISGSSNQTFYLNAPYGGILSIHVYAAAFNEAANNTIAVFLDGTVRAYVEGGRYISGITSAGESGTDTYYYAYTSETQVLLIGVGVGNHSISITTPGRNYACVGFLAQR